MPVSTRGVSRARSKPVRQVAEPRTNSPVRVSVMRMDQVAFAVDAARARVVERMRRRDILVFGWLCVILFRMYQKYEDIPRKFS